jgi:hypothetical protein
MPQATVNVAPDGVSQLIRKFYPSDDAVVYEGDPDRNFGSHWEMGINYRDGFRDRTFIMFDLRDIPPGSIIGSATLNIYMYDAPNLSRTLACYEVNKKWYEYRITWSNQPSATVFVASASTGTKPKLLSLNVKNSLVKFTAKDIYDYVPNYGWMLKDLNEGSGSEDDPFWMCSRDHGDSTKRPYLEVKYYPPHLELVLSSSSMEAGNWVKMTVHRKANDGNPITRGDLKVKLSSNSTSLSKKFSLTQGGDAITELTILDDSDYTDFYYYDEKAGTWKITVWTDDYADYIGDDENLKVNPSQLGFFVFNEVSSPKTVAIPFSITITAYDIFENVKTDYSGRNFLSDTTGTINPNITDAFKNGKWTGNVTINCIGNDIRITTSGGGKTGESNLFNILAGPPAKIIIEPSNFTMAAGVAYSHLNISLRDANNFETTSTSPILVSFSSSSSTGRFREFRTDTIINGVTIPADSSTVKVDYYDTMVGNKTLTAWAEGLKSGTAIARVVHDTAPPVTTIIVSDPKYQNNTILYVSGLTIFTFSAVDDISGIRETRYRVNEGPWSTYSNMFTLSAYPNGSNAIGYYSVDKSGNSEDEKTLTVILDKDPPHIEDVSPTGRLFLSSSSVIFTVKITDPGSGVKEVELTVDGVSQGDMTKSRAKYTKTVSLSEGSHSWSIRAVDNLNNSATQNYSFTLTLDTVLPIISELSAPPNPVFGEPTPVTCKVSDELSGIKQVNLYYSPDGGSSWECLTMFLQEDVYTGSIPSQLFFTEVQYYVEAVDNAGNRSRTTVLKYTVGIPVWLYLIISALIVVSAAIFLLRRLLKKRMFLKQTYTSSGGSIVEICL